MRRERDLTKLVELPNPTSHTERGPIITVAERRASVRYDCEAEGGFVVWTDLVFGDVLTLSYRNMAACTEEDVIGFDYVVEEDATPDLEEAVRRWTAFAGWQEHERREEAQSPFRRFRVFFDDVGTVEVIARSLEIVHPASAE